MFGNPVGNPQKWKTYRLIDICTKLTDGTHSSPNSYESGEYRYVTAKNIKLDGFDFSNITYVTEDVHNEIYSRCNPEYGDVLYIKDGATTGIAMVNTLYKPFTMLSSVALLKHDRSIIDGVYLCGVLNNTHMYDSIRSNMGGAAITRLTISKLNNIIIPVPPIKLQKEFASFVHQVDKSKVAIQKCFIITESLGETKMNDFIKELQDLRYLDWENKKISIGTPGSFLKAYEEKEGIRIYYKMSNYDSYRGIFGHECVNELIVSRLLDILDIPHLSYQLVFAKLCIDEQEMEGYIVRSVNFRKENEKKIVFDTYYELHREKKESPLEFAKRYGWEQYVYQMFVVDYLICNRDRHGANIEVLIDEKDKPRLAPLFDHGLSLLFSCYDNLENVRKLDILEDRAVNNFIGSKSLEYNLQLLPKGQKFFPGELKEEHKETLMEGLEQVLSKEYLDKIWEMIWERWKHYAKVCN